MYIVVKNVIVDIQINLEKQVSTNFICHKNQFHVRIVMRFFPRPDKNVTISTQIRIAVVLIATVMEELIKSCYTAVLIHTMPALYVPKDSRERFEALRTQPPMGRISRPTKHLNSNSTSLEMYTSKIQKTKYLNLCPKERRELNDDFCSCS